MTGAHVRRAPTLASALVRLTLALTLFVGALAARPVVAEPFASAFRTTTTFVLRAIPGYELALRDHRMPEFASRDTAIWVSRVGHPRDRWIFFVDSGVAGYQCAALFAALWLVTGLPWRRRLVAAVVGGLLVFAYVQLRVGVILLDGFVDHLQYCLDPASHWKVLRDPAWRGRADWLLHAFHMDFTAYNLAPVAAWAIASFRREDLALLLRARGRRGSDAQVAESGLEPEADGPPSVAMPKRSFVAWDAPKRS